MEQCLIIIIFARRHGCLFLLNVLFTFATVTLLLLIYYVIIAGISLLERLMTHNPLYGKATGAYNPEFVTKLLLNYRFVSVL